jgi:ACS family glucarate transporter-like MFS transporter
MSLDASQRPTKVRHLVIAVTTVMAVLLYLDRLCVGIASNYIREDLGLTQTQMAQFLGAFFWSYALAQVPSGWFSDRYGARIMLVIYIVSWSICTALVGAAASFALLWGTRFAVGLAQAGAYPTAGGLISKWVPLTSRGGASSMVALGGRFGGMAAPILTAYLMVLFTPLSVPATIADKALLNGPRLCARIGAPQSPSDDGDAIYDYGPTAAGSIIALHLPVDILELVTRQADRYRPLKQAVVDLEEKKKQSGIAPPELPSAIAALDELRLPPEKRAIVLTALNELLKDPLLFTRDHLVELNIQEAEVRRLAARRDAGETLSTQEVERLNRLALEAAFPGDIARLYGHGWRMVMVVYGLAGVVVAGLFWFCFRDHPDRHPWCNEAERELIAAGRPRESTDSPRADSSFPLVAVLTNVSLWLNCAMQITTNIGWLFLVTWLPRYLTDVHHVSLAQSGLMTAIPTGIGIVGMFVGGRLTDLLVPRVGVRWGRRGPMMFTRFTAALGYGLCLLMAQSDPSAASQFNNPWYFVAALSLVALSVDMGNPAVWAYCQDVGGNSVGSILGWGNMWGNFGAAFAPSIYNHVLGETPTLGDWNTMFGVCVAAFILSGLCAWGVDAATPIVRADRAAGDG